MPQCFDALGAAEGSLRALSRASSAALHSSSSSFISKRFERKRSGKLFRPAAAVPLDKIPEFGGDVPVVAGTDLGDLVGHIL